MPEPGVVLVSPAGERRFFYQEDVDAAVRAGWAPPTDVRVDSTLSDTSARLSPGQFIDTTLNDPGAVTGSDPALEQAAFAKEEERARYQGAGQQVLGGLEGVAGIATLSGSDWLLEGLGADTALRKEHTAGRTVGEVVGTVATAVSPFGKGGLAKAVTKFTPGGAISKFGADGGSALARVARTAGEGAAYGVAQASSNIALANLGLSAEAVWSELGQGAVLGLALGGGAGVVGEGISWAGRTFTEAKAARSTSGLDFDSGPAKDALGTMARAHREVDDAVGFANRERDKLVQSVVDDLEGTRTANLARDAAEVHAGLGVAGKPDPALVESLVAARARIDEALAVNKLSKAGLRDLEAAHNALAMAQGGKGVLAPNAVDMAIQGAAKRGLKSIEELTAASDELLAAAAGPNTSRLDKMLQRATESGKAKDWLRYHTAASKFADEVAAPELKQLSEAAVAKFREDAKFIAEYTKSLPKQAFDSAQGKALFDLRPEQLLKPDHLRRLVRSDPAELVTKASRLNKFYDDAATAAADNPLAAKQVQQAVAEYKRALNKLLPADAQAHLEGQVLASALGTTVPAEALVGPGGVLLKLAAADKVLLSTGKSRAKSGVLRRLIQSGLRRGGAAAGYKAAQVMGGGFFTTAIGGMAGFQAGAAVARAGSQGTKAAIDATVTLKDLTRSAAMRAATGKPRKARAMPLLNHVLDKMLGDTAEAKKAKPEVKFKLLQDRLARFNAAPDAVMNGAYQVLQPMQQVSEQLADHMELTLATQLQHAYDTMPKDPGTTMYSGVSRWQPTDRQLREWGFSLMGIAFPGAVVDAIADGLCPPQAAQALAVANPEVFAEMQQQLLENADAIREHSTKNQRVALGLAFGIPLDPTTDPRYVAFMQNMHAQQTMEQAAGGAGEPKKPEDEFTDAQKLLS